MPCGDVEARRKGTVCGANMGFQALDAIGIGCRYIVLLEPRWCVLLSWSPSASGSWCGMGISDSPQQQQAEIDHAAGQQTPIYNI